MPSPVQDKTVILSAVSLTCAQIRADKVLQRLKNEDRVWIA